MKLALIVFLTTVLAGVAIRQHQTLSQSFALLDQSITQTERAIAAGEKWRQTAMQCGETTAEDKR